MTSRDLLPLHFWKMHGCGNHFIVCEISHELSVALSEDIVRRICDPHFGIGADGIMAIVVGEKPHNADLEVIMKNPDGSNMGMCGNGIRCVARYVSERDIVRAPLVRFLVEGRIIETENKGNEISVNLGQYSFEPRDIPVNATSPLIDNEITVNDKAFSVTALAVPNPHAVTFVSDELSAEDLRRWGSALENHPQFPSRTNVEFVRVLSQSEISVQVWERGAGATLACGTGACASVIAGVKTGRVESPCTVNLPGGAVRVSLSESASVVLIGPAAKIFEGVYT